MKNFKTVLTSLLITPIILTTAYANTISVDGEYVETEMVILEERTLIQARSLVDAIGGDIEWNEAERLVTISHEVTEAIIQLTIDERTALVNGEEIEIEVPPTILEGYTFLPLRFIAENLGFYVDFVHGIVTIITPSFVPQTLAYLESNELLENLEVTVLYRNLNVVGEHIEAGYYTVVSPMDNWGFFSVLNENNSVIFTEGLLGENVPQFIQSLLDGTPPTSTVYLLDGHKIDLENFRYLLFVR